MAVALSAGLTKEQAAARYEEEEIDLSNTQSAVKADAKSIAIEDAQKRIGRWRLLYPTFGKVISICKTVCHSLNLMKTAVVKFRFKSVGELFQRLTISNIWFRKFFPFDVVYVPGYPKFLYQTFCDKFTDEFNGMFFRFKNYLEVIHLCNDFF